MGAADLSESAGQDEPDALESRFDGGAGTIRTPSQSDDPMTQQSVDTADNSSDGVVLASRTDVGQVRPENQDSCDTARRADGAQLLVVADGMGGHRGGGTASRTAITSIVDEFESDSSVGIDALLRSAIESANTRIFEMSQADTELDGMGTTVVALVIDAQHRATVAHVGDSRAYRYRRGQLEQLTTDHSMVAEMQRRGLISAEEAATHPRRNEILRSVGVVPDVEVDVANIDIEPGDRFLLCSDGLSGVVTDEEIAAVIQSNTPQVAVDALVDLANERGGPDNITVQILSVPTSVSEGDPEATAPVELSDIGIEAIESKRRERAMLRRLWTAALIVGILAAAYVVWRFVGGIAGLHAEPADASPATRSALEREHDADAPRRGIPH